MLPPHSHTAVHKTAPTNPQRPLNVLIIDDEEFYRDTLTAYLAAYADLTVVAVAENGAQALHILESTPVDVALCDVRMPLFNGVDFTKTATARKLTCKILALTSFNDDRAMLGMLHAGAVGFLLKSADQHEIINAIRAAATGAMSISPEATNNLRKYLTPPPITIEGLPDRERDVLALLHLGKSNDSIAAALHVSVISVKKAVSRLMQRFNVSSRMELVAITRVLDQ